MPASVSTELDCQRAMLFSARLRISHETQPVREMAIDRILERNLLVGYSEDGLTLSEIEQLNSNCEIGILPFINNKNDLRKSLERLVNEKKVIKKRTLNKTKYWLSKDSLEELRNVLRDTEKRFERVVDRHFNFIKNGSAYYKAPFLECLCIVFSKLGEDYVHILRGETSSLELQTNPIVTDAIKAIISEHPSIDEDLFKKEVLRFFQECDPDCDEIKWNMAQNYYIAKALGIDPSGHLLSKEVIGNSTFFLDTNIVIDALDPESEHFESYKAFSNACKQLEIKLKLCKISLKELESVIRIKREMIEKVSEQIPDETAGKIDGTIYKLFREQKCVPNKASVENVLKRFDKPIDKLSDIHKVELVDDPWFEKAGSAKETIELVTKIKNEYQNKVGRAKWDSSALHDALLMQWVQQERKKDDRTWLLTLDTSLPHYSLSQTDGISQKPLAITLDVLLQWLSPLTTFTKEVSYEDSASIFADALKYHLIPRDKFLDLRDFIIFAEMDWQCKELPPDDVEKCISYLKKDFSNLDPSRPDDRNKMARQIAKFFADPSRRYKEDKKRLEDENKSLKNDNTNLRSEIAELKHTVNIIN